MRLIAQLTLLCVLCLLTYGSPCHAGDPNVDQVKAGVSDAYRKLRAAGTQYQDDFKVVVYRSGDTPEPAERMISTTACKRRSRSDGYYLSESSVSDPMSAVGSVQQPGSMGRVWCYNPRYEFQLRANRTQDWLISRCVVVGSSDYTDTDQAGRDEAFSAAPYDAHYRNVVSAPLPTFFDNKNVKVGAITRSPTKPDCHRIAFTAVGDDFMPGVKIPLTMSGWFDIDPASDWSVVESVGTTKLPEGTAETKHSFVTRNVNGLTLVTRHTQETIAQVPGKTVKTRIVSEFNPRLAAGPDSDEFTLARYGMPEPLNAAPPPPKPTPLYVWLLTAAGLFLLLAVGTRWLLRRRLRNTQTTPSAVR